MDIHIAALYYFGMYKYATLWRNCNDVENGMRSFKSISLQDHSLKENIRFFVMGFGWTESDQSWSKNGVK